MVNIDLPSFFFLTLKCPVSRFTQRRCGHGKMKPVPRGWGWFHVLASSSSSASSAPSASSFSSSSSSSSLSLALLSIDTYYYHYILLYTPLRGLLSSWRQVGARFQVRKNSRFKRLGDDLMADLRVSLSEAPVDGTTFWGSIWFHGWDGMGWVMMVGIWRKCNSDWVRLFLMLNVVMPVFTDSLQSG